MFREDWVGGIIYRQGVKGPEGGFSHESQWFKLREMWRNLFGTLDRFKLWLFECFQWILALKGSKNWIKAKEGQKGQWRPTKAN